MVTESPTLDDRALADDIAVVKERLLPLIRIRTYRPLTYFPERQEIIGLFPDEIIRVRVRKTVAVPETIYEPGGAEKLRELGEKFGRTIAVPLDRVKSLISRPRSILRENDKLKLVGSDRTVVLQVRQNDTPNLYRVLGELLGPRYRHRNGLPPLGSYARVPFFLALLAAALFFTFGIPMFSPLRVVSPVLWAITLVFLVIGVADSIPGRTRAGGMTKAKPLKDLSGREPVRLRVAGMALTIAGSLFALYNYGGVLYESVRPVLRGGLEANDAWYTKILELGLPVFVMFAAGSFAFGSVGTLTVYVVLIALVIGMIPFVQALVMFPSVEVFYLTLWRISSYFGLYLITIGRRMVSRNARTAITSDKRAPILYLRSFEDDVADTLTPNTTLARLFAITLPTDVRRLPLWQRVIFEIHPLRLLRSLFGRITPTTELQLAGYFRPIGPFIAIGKPGERLATIGADREFVDQAKWQDVVLDFIDKSRYVVLQAAGTEGFLWELKTVLNRVDPTKILFCLSNFRGRQNDYEDFRLNAESVLGWRFPRSVGNQDEPQFLFFKADRTPISHTLSYCSPILWPVRGQVTDLDHTLADFVDRSREAAVPYQVKTYPGHSAIAVILFLTVIPFAWGALMYVTLVAAGMMTPSSVPRL